MAEPLNDTQAGRIALRPVCAADEFEFLDNMRSSRSLHEPWLFPPLSRDAFREYLRRCQQDDHEGLLVRRKSDEALLGVINLNNIVRGAFLCASLGYYACAKRSGHGYMREGLFLAKRYAFDVLGLHRLEANIQPGNIRSINLARACGFTCEGISPAFLYIDGQWRDHERWACVDHRSTLGTR